MTIEDTNSIRSGGPPDWLLPSKIAVPPARAQLVGRPHLFQRLTEGLRHPLTLITAPAGFGKTTLISAWCGTREVRDVPLAWLSLDESDDDPNRFWSYVLSALQVRLPGFGDAALASLQGPQPVAVEDVLKAVVRELALSDSELGLVIDDYHLVEQESIHRQVGFLLNHLPLHFHLLISSRSEPPLPLARLRVRDLLVEIREDDLRFSSDEAAAFLHAVMNLDVSADVVSALEGATEGWVAGLQLAALSMRQRADPQAFIASFTGSHRYIIDYLVEEVVQRQPQRVQAFLLRTAILDRLSGPLCAAVTGYEDGQQLLEYLDRSNLFVAGLDDERRWYRYHRLFADVLRQRLHHTVPDIPVLHRRAAEWYLTQHMTEEAIGHALAASDAEHAASLVEGPGRELLQTGDLATLRGWLLRLPADLIRSRARLAITQAWVNWVGSASSPTSDAEARMRAVETLVDDAERGVGADEPELRGEIAALRSHIACARGNNQLATELSQRALARLPETEVWVRGSLMLALGAAAYFSGDLLTSEKSLTDARLLGERARNSLLVLYATTLLATVFEIRGRLHEAARVQEWSLQVATRTHGPRLPAAGLALVGLGRLRYEWNELDTAAQSIRDGLEALERGALYGTGPDSRVALARVLQAQGDAEGALMQAEQALQLAAELNDARLKLRASAGQAAIWLLQGHRNAVSRWLEQCEVKMTDEITEFTESTYFTLARAHLTLARGDTAGEHLAAATAILHHLGEKVDAEGRIGRLIEVLALQALVSETRGNHARSLQDLARALALAEPEGYVRIFVDEGVAMARLLTKLATENRRDRSAGTTAGYVQALLNAFGGVPPAAVSQQVRQVSLAEPLSVRELEVLKLMAAGASNDQIAQQMVVGRATVKTHVNRLYRKLEVGNRVAAVVRARELSLI